MASLYKIISEGYAKEGLDKNEVIKRISIRFKMDVEKATRLVSGRAVVLRSDLDYVTMEKYSKVLESTGLRFKVEPSAAEKKFSDSVSTASGFACPKCGFENHVDLNNPLASCSKCGVVFDKLAAKEKKSEASNQKSNKKVNSITAVPSNRYQEGIQGIKEEFNKLPGSIKVFWCIMIFVYIVVLLRAVNEGGVGFFFAVAIGAGFVWFYLPYYCMRKKGFWHWVWTIVWTFPFGLGLLSESAKAYFLSDQ